MTGYRIILRLFQNNITVLAQTALIVIINYRTLVQPNTTE